MRARSHLRFALRPVRGRFAPLTPDPLSATRPVMRLCLAAPLCGHGIPGYEHSQSLIVEQGENVNMGVSILCFFGYEGSDKNRYSLQLSRPEEET